ncbi:hypothetical protein Scep_024415 [Stephania cephalantha]|uniref:Uncharacterized protein n=1 Tax=Stephania cephalantha TaxID=152367 RepID=A0AAP0EZ97_9MAGN
MCHGSSQDFMDSIAVEIAAVAPFKIFSGGGSSKPTIPSGQGAVEADLVPPYQYLTLTRSQVALSSRVECQDHLGAYPLLPGIISELEDINVWLT